MKHSLQRFFDYFLIGVLGVLPIVIVLQVVIYVENLLRNFVVNFFGGYQNLLIPGVMFAAAVLFLIYFGYLLKHGKAHLLYFVERLFNRVPLLGAMYRVTQKLVNIFRGDGSTKLREVVYIEYPKDGLWVPAFVTNRVGDRYVVYVPTSPNPTSGFTVILHESKIMRSRMTIEEASSFVISLGVDMPKPGEATELK